MKGDEERLSDKELQHYMTDELRSSHDYYTQYDSYSRYLSGNNLYEAISLPEFAFTTCGISIIVQKSSQTFRHLMTAVGVT